MAGAGAGRAALARAVGAGAGAGAGVVGGRGARAAAAAAAGPGPGSAAAYGVCEDGPARMSTQSGTEWLAGAPRGAYTTARTVGGGAVYEFSRHVQRTAESAALMLPGDCPEPAGGRGLSRADVVEPALLRPHIEHSLRAAAGCFRENRPDHAGELRLTVLVALEGQAGPRVWAHVGPLPPRPARPVRVWTAGAPRQNARAKDSDWVRQREGLEALKGDEVEEIVLVDSAGDLLEGLSSNFFALVGGSLQTAEEGVLMGTVRAAALDVCAREGVPVERRAPKAADMAAWEGAFISSTSRLLLPVDEIARVSASGAVLEKRTFPRSPLADRLERLVLEDVQRRSESVFF